MQFLMIIRIPEKRVGVIKYDANYYDPRNQGGILPERSYDSKDDLERDLEADFKSTELMDSFRSSPKAFFAFVDLTEERAKYYGWKGKLL